MDTTERLSTHWTQERTLEIFTASELDPWIRGRPSSPFLTSKRVCNLFLKLLWRPLEVHYHSCSLLSIGEYKAELQRQYFFLATHQFMPEKGDEESSQHHSCGTPCPPASHRLTQVWEGEWARGRTRAYGGGTQQLQMAQFRTPPSTLASAGCPGGM